MNNLCLGEILTNLEQIKDRDILLLNFKRYAKMYPELKTFFSYAYLNERVGKQNIPDYNISKLPMGFTYLKLNKALHLLEHFFEGNPNTSQMKKREPKNL